MRALGQAVGVLHRHLGLAVRPQVGQNPLLAALGQAQAEVMGQHYGERHQLRRLRAGEAHHDPLVAGTLVGADGGCYLRRLLLDGDDDPAAIAVEPVLGLGVADVADDLAGYAGVVHVVMGGYLAQDDHQAGGGGDLAGHVGLGIAGQDLVQDGVRYLVAQLVGVPLGDRLRGHVQGGRAHEGHLHGGVSFPYVPSSQDDRYFRCSSVNSSMVMSMEASFRRATSWSISAGTG